MLKGVIHAALAYGGDEIRQQYFRFMDTQYRKYYGLCAICGAQAPEPGDEVCRPCFEAVEREDRESRMDDDPIGSVS